MMRRLCRRVSGWHAPGYLDPGDLEARAKIGQLEGWLSILLNTLMAAAKGGLGMATGSLALLSDAAHTLADSASSVVKLRDQRDQRDVSVYAGEQEVKKEIKK